jgi:hypothetical protein
VLPLHSWTQLGVGRQAVKKGSSKAEVIKPEKLKWSKIKELEMKEQNIFSEKTVYIKHQIYYYRV